MTDLLLRELRDNIRQTDQELVQMLNRRARLSREIGAIKVGLGKEVYDPSQESMVYDHLAATNGEDLPLQSLQAIFREIISASRRLQGPMTVAYLGPEASFAHLAAKSHFGEGSQFLPQASIAGIFDEVEKGKVKWGVVPVENSLEGSVNLTLDCLMTTMLQIRAEIFLRISHCLLSRHEHLADVEMIYSHPQALAQCQMWLRANLPHATLVEVESTAAAAQKAAREEKGAAICSRAAAELYELKVFAEGIEDKASNTTRFLVIGAGEGKPTGCDKTSLLFSTSHQSGALHRALQSFADRGINMMKIESHPVKDRLWEYLFFVDVAGHVRDEKMQQCLTDLRKNTAFVKILGSYSKNEGRP
jgi:chorismate mutase/prephenate dehydratase